MSQGLKDIAVFFDLSDCGRSLLGVAANMAERERARLIGICCPDLEVVSQDSGQAYGAAARAATERRGASMAAELMRAGQVLGDMAIDLGVDAELRAIFQSEDSRTLALHCDLLVVGYPEAPGARFAWSSYAILQQVGVPLLVVPNAWQGDIGRHVLLAWCGAAPARSDVTRVLPLLASAESVALMQVDPEAWSEKTVAAEQPLAEWLAEQAGLWEADLVVLGGCDRGEAATTVFGKKPRQSCGMVPLVLLF
ncbi:universal stress protein [Corticimicrobacter populi]|uniref:Universal stress protein n=1 Tax=Corticimicrobacter populi TaxID=2175229 RepID=A0A2V1K379_9BURK|nr:universal stress protein [Corticimicrobacter populi]PWF24673.1 universal stress protein [Corticimicrobacter populi]